MTPRRQEILDLFLDYRQTHGCSPTLDEFSAYTELKWGRGKGLSRTSVDVHLKALIESGHLVRTGERKSRGIQPAKRILVDISDVLAVVDKVFEKSVDLASVKSLKRRIRGLPTGK